MADKPRPEERPCRLTLGAFHGTHRYMLGGVIYQCPGGSYHLDAPFIVESESRPYEVRTTAGERYLAEADDVRQDVAWVNFRAGGVLTLSVRATDVRTIRQVDPEEIENAADAPDPRDTALARVRELPESPTDAERIRDLEYVIQRAREALGAETPPCDHVARITALEETLQAVLAHAEPHTERCRRTGAISANTVRRWHAVLRGEATT